MPDLAFVNTDFTRFNVLIPLNHQRLRQPEMDIAALTLDLFVAFQLDIQFRHRDGNQRPDHLLRPAGALTNSIFDFITIIRSLNDYLPDHRQWN